MRRVLGRSDQGDEENWLSVSDIMSGLMMVFLFIAIVYIRPWMEQKEVIKEVIVRTDTVEMDLLADLEREFRDDLPRWDAEIDPDQLTFRFRSPEVLFDLGSDVLKERFRTILADFFPRYLAVLQRYRAEIEEVRIEGHTSREWRGTTNLDEAYFRNMALSQGRTRSVLELVMTMPAVRLDRDWVVAHVTANGLASSKIVQRHGAEDAERSRRVEFKIRTKVRERLMKIKQALEQG